MKPHISSDSLLSNLSRRTANLFSQKNYYRFELLEETERTKDENLLVEMDTRKKTETTLKRKLFHTTKCRVYTHERLNISKYIQSIYARKSKHNRNRELALAKAEEMTAALGEPSVTNIRKISIRKGEKQIHTIPTFN